MNYPFVVNVKNLTVFFKNHQILKSLTFSVPHRGITILSGPSGCGKTTLLRTLNRLNEEEKGYKQHGVIEYNFHGKTFNSSHIPPTELRRKVAMVFQNPTPLPLSIEQNFLMPLYAILNQKKDQARETMRNSLVNVGLWAEVKDRLDEPATSLSGGQAQRLCFARALALQPEMLLLDEPTSSLDPESSNCLENLIRQLGDKMPILMVSHNFQQAQRLGDQHFLLSNSQLKNKIIKKDA